MTTSRITIGQTYGRNPTYAIQSRVAIDPRSHTYMVGVSGSGKSTKMENMIVEDIRAKRGICLVDPHAVLVSNILKRIPKEMRDKVRILDPHSKKPLALRMLEHGDQTLVNDFISVLKVFGRGDDSIRARAEMILKNILYAIVAIELHPTPYHLYRYFTESSYRDTVNAQIDELTLKTFAMYWNEDVNDRMREDAEVAPFGKVSLMLAFHKLRHMFVQTEDTLDFYEAMQEGYIVLCPLDSALLGHEETSVLGSSILLKITQAAKRRFKLVQNGKPCPPFRVYVDEAHIVTYGSSVEQLLNETRKGEVFLTLAFQMLDQFESRAKSAVRSARNQLVFAVSDLDAVDLAEGFGVVTEKLSRLPRGWCYAKVVENETPRGPYLIEPEIWREKRAGKSSKQKIRLNSEVRYTAPYQGDETTPDQILEYHEANFGRLRADIDAQLAIV